MWNNGRRVAAATVAFFLIFSGGVMPAPAQSDRRPNVLFIAIDDLNDWVGCLGGHPQVKTPRIDELARRGTLFTNAHCQAPLCNPSRASILSGLRPSTTGLYSLLPAIRSVPALKERTMLPQHFARHGYATYGAGKIYHGPVKSTSGTEEFQTWGSHGPVAYPPKKFVETPDKIRGMDWGVYPERDEEQGDWKTARSAVEWLKSLPPDKPFFMALGFRFPHVPCFASQRWFDLYPKDKLILPPVKRGDRDDVPPFAWYLHWKLPEPRLSWLEKAGEWKPLVRSYLATTSFMDSQVGRVLDALEASGEAERTVVVLWSDHGFHLGEKGITGKNTLWERSTRVPLIFAGPGVTSGSVCSSPAELLDLYPTLIELCALSPDERLEGQSLAPQLKDARAPRIRPAITTANQGNDAVRSEQWRFIRYADGSQELYDLRTDPNEWTNLAGNPEFADIIREHSRWLPADPAPPVAGSANRLLVREGEEWLWEGTPIVPEEGEF